MKIKTIITICIMLIAAALLVSCFLFGGGNKDIIILAYPNVFNKEDITMESNIYTLLKITPAINGRTLFVTNPDGKLSFKDIPEGEYTIHPVFVDSIYDKTLFVPGDTYKEIAYPSAGIICAVVNVNSDVAELQNANVRDALACAITRATLLANIPDTGSSAIFLIPPAYYGLDGMDYMQGIFEGNPVDAMLQNNDPFSFDFLHPDTKADMAAEMKSQWEDVEKVVEVTTVSSDLETFKADFIAKNFDIARWGWVLDSNNLLSYLKKVAGVAGYTDVTLEGLFTAAATALENNDLETHTDRLEDIVSHLNNRMCTIPLYFTDP